MLKVPKNRQGVKKAAHRRSPVQEGELAARFGGKLVKGSGCGFDKGDVRVRGKVLIEAKTTERKSFSVTREIIDKLESAACSNGEIPVLVVEFIGERKQTLCVIPEWALNSLMGK